MKNYTVAVLVNNKLGVLNRVTSMFRRRQFNITALTVSETESTLYSRITVMFEGEDTTKQQLINQLYKLPDVCSIIDLNAQDSVSRELMLIKMKNEQETRREIMDAAEVFHAKVVDYHKESFVLQMTADRRRIDDFVDLMRDYTILEICRTGVVSLERGSSTIRKITNL
jgi:acetolactate synthase-1/3 small subunit